MPCCPPLAESVADPYAATETPLVFWAKAVRGPEWLAEVTTNPSPLSMSGPLPSGWTYCAG